MINNHMTSVKQLQGEWIGKVINICRDIGVNHIVWEEVFTDGD